ncbi:MAG: alpha/beta hydrolase domain-containing protein [Sphingomonas sp.]|uniref:alpha/beta hydrolase domain-containing protein n=1 Tax=Sphingomonas sp. TaxID=28214 RepID=UPI003566CDE0
MRIAIFLTAGSALAVSLATPALPRVVRVQIDSLAPAPAKPGAVPYEIVRGRFFGALDPADAHNRDIVDIESAPVDAQGRVLYSATFAIARPVDRTKASGVLFYDVPNRGGWPIGADIDGHVRVISGWQGDLTPADGLQTATVPVAHGKNGAPVTGPVLARFTDMPAGASSIPIVGSIGRPTPRPLPVTLDTRQARLFRQTSDKAAPVDLKPTDWAFADCSATPFPGTPDPTMLCVRGGFDPAFAYTLVYQGKDPLVLGIGFAATRDLVSYLRSGKPDDAGNANPAGVIRWTVASGTSQSGNFLKSFVNLGFNADEAGARVFDGINPNIAARQVPLNLRFAVPGGAASLYEPGSEGTLWWGRYNDVTRRRGVSSLLDRCAASNTCPKVIETFGSAEFWGLRLSPGLIGTDAKADLPLPANVRRYYFPSVTHGGSFTGGFPVAGDPGLPVCALRGNPNSSLESLRAAQAMLVTWVRGGKAPPVSRYPTLKGGDLVAANARAMGWPSWKGAPSPDGKLNVFLDYDMGPGFRYHDVSGVISRQPPAIRRTIPSRVPRVNADGNETAGVPSVQLQVPIGTYLGWNVQLSGYGKGGGCGFFGGFIPFARSRAERIAAGDPRPSLEERYGTHAGFVARVRATVAIQQAAGWLRPEDAVNLVAQAEKSKILGD